MGDAVIPTPEDELDGEEGWQRLTTEPEVRGIEVVGDDLGGDWPWTVDVWAMNGVRDDPLEDELRDAIGAALSAVSGVTGVAEEDREVWVVAGATSGRDLAQAAAEVIDRYADRIRAHLA